MGFGSTVDNGIHVWPPSKLTNVTSNEPIAWRVPPEYSKEFGVVIRISGVGKGVNSVDK